MPSTLRQLALGHDAARSAGHSARHGRLAACPVGETSGIVFRKRRLQNHENTSQFAPICTSAFTVVLTFAVLFLV
jgi:hypothetical protein